MERSVMRDLPRHSRISLRSIRATEASIVPTKSDLIRSYFAAYKTRDRKALEDAFADDFTFTSPYDDAIDKAAYFERCWPISTSGRMVSNEVERTRPPAPCGP